MPSHQGQTDKTLKIKLPSAILEARWGLAEVAAGGTVPVEVSTYFVADGSQIKATLKDLQGEVIETVSGKVYSNLFRAPYKVSKPNKTGGMLFEAELPAHSLKRMSAKIRVGPPVKITELKILDEKGSELKEIAKSGRIQLTGKIEGPPAGTPCHFTLYLDSGKPEAALVQSIPAKIEGGKATCTLDFASPSWEPKHLVQRDLDRDGGSYAPLQYFFELGCLGVHAKSPLLEYVSWVELDFGPIKGKAVLIMPDGTEETKDIPADGILKVASPGAGRILLKDIIT